MSARLGQLPNNLFRYVFTSSWQHQIALVALTIVTFLLEVVPLEIQRRVVNSLVKERPFQPVILLCAAYAGAVLVQGAIKLGLNVYRGWVSENSTRHLRRRVIGYSRLTRAAASSAEARGIGAAMIVAEVEPIGGFVGSSISEPLLQIGILLSVLGYIVHLDRWMAAAAIALFAPQLIFVPLIQGAINRRAGARVWLLRQLGISTVRRPTASVAEQDRSDIQRIDRVLQLNMGIFKLKYSMNFLMNFCSHLQVVAALLIGGWMVHTDQLEVGGVVAFISAVGRLNDPWGDLVNYFRDLNVTQVKFELLADRINQPLELAARAANLRESGSTAVLAHPRAMPPAGN
jgi:ABC-type bacteriocin/lantibiotic exporter with double-glycine peptidase domain